MLILLLIYYVDMLIVLLIYYVDIDLTVLNIFLISMIMVILI